MTQQSPATTSSYDVAVIGAGAVGSATASALVRAGFQVLLLEAGPDVGAGTSKANTAIWHTGFDAKPGTLEARLVARGYQLLAERADAFNWPLERVGAVLVAWDSEQRGRLDEIRASALAVGYQHVSALTIDEVYRTEPHLGPGVTGGLAVPDEGLLDPWSITLALASDAVRNGATLRTNARVERAVRGDGLWLLNWPLGSARARWVVNAAGLHSDEVNRLLGFDGFTVMPRRGQLIVFDKCARDLVQHIVLPVPTATTKGVLVSPTVYGNVLLGPTAEDLSDRTATQTTQEGLTGLLDRGARIMPALVDQEVTATYAGLRAATEHADYCYEFHRDAGYVCAGGIRSTGISSCLAIAEEIVAQLAEIGEQPAPLQHPVTTPMPNLAEARLRPYQDAAAIERDPDYGALICLCERVSRGEVRDALAATIPAVDLDGIRRRTRALTGRCQGFHCGASLEAMLTNAGHDDRT